MKIRESGAVFCDYNWTNRDYLEVIENNRFVVQKIHSPLGNEKDGIQWRDETKYSPYYIQQ